MTLNSFLYGYAVGAALYAIAFVIGASRDLLHGREGPKFHENIATIKRYPFFLRWLVLVGVPILTVLWYSAIWPVQVWKLFFTRPA